MWDPVESEGEHPHGTQFEGAGATRDEGLSPGALLRQSTGGRVDVFVTVNVSGTHDPTLPLFIMALTGESRPVPEPASLGLLVLGMVLLAARAAKPLARPST
jgi:hypothetical protein